MIARRVEHPAAGPDPVQYTRPSLSTFIPSGTPSSAECISAKMRLLLSEPSAATSNARMNWCSQTSPRSFSAMHASSRRVIATYSTLSSGEKARPLGYSVSRVAMLWAPDAETRCTPLKSSSRSSAVSRPLGSVKYSDPSDRPTTSLGAVDSLVSDVRSNGRV